MKAGVLLTTALLLAACQKTPEIERTEYERLQTRVAVLEARVAELSEKRQVVAPPVAAAPVPPPKSQMTYQLIGTAFRDEGTFRYPTKARCESARQSLVSDWAAEDARNRERGVIMTHPTPTCIPL